MWHHNRYVVFGLVADVDRPVLIGPFNSLPKTLLFLARFGKSLARPRVYVGRGDLVGVMRDITDQTDPLVVKLRTKLSLTGEDKEVLAREIGKDALLGRAKVLLSNVKIV